MTPAIGLPWASKPISVSAPLLPNGTVSTGNEMPIGPDAHRSRVKLMMPALMPVPVLTTTGSPFSS